MRMLRDSGSAHSQWSTFQRSALIDDSWGVQHVMHPDLGDCAFVRWYTSDELVNVVCELMACGEEDLQMGGGYLPSGFARWKSPLKHFNHSQSCLISSS